MRFFAHDGKTVHGPSTLDELLQVPGFDGDTLVCPLGSENSADWKPALAYPPFRDALLTPVPKAAPPPPPSAPPPTIGCPRCMQANPEGAKFCNGCAGRMDGVEEIPPPPPSAAPKYLLGGLIGAACASGAFGWWISRAPAARPAPAPDRTEAPAIARSTTTAAAVAPAISAVPARPPAPVPVPPPAAPRILRKVRPAATAPKKISPVAKRAKRLPRAPKHVPTNVPKEEKAAPAAPAPGAAAPQTDQPAFLLPGVPRRVTSPSVAKPTPAAPPATDASSSSADEGSERQVREQFEFCAQLLSQGAFADHFDTCLCAAARQVPPYLGRRDAYAAALKKAAAAGTLEASAKISAVAIDGGGAKVTADWTTQAGAASSTTENWRLEDGLWCRAP